MDNDVNLSLTKSGENAISFKVTDRSSSMNYMLSDTSIINAPPKMKQMPQFDLEINVTQAMIIKFISGKTALSDEDYFTVITNGDNAKLVIGYASVNTNRVTIPVTTNKNSLM